MSGVEEVNLMGGLGGWGVGGGRCGHTNNVSTVGMTEAGGFLFKLLASKARMICSVVRRTHVSDSVFPHLCALILHKRERQTVSAWV